MFVLVGGDGEDDGFLIPQDQAMPQAKRAC